MSPLSEIICREIAERGDLSFARFMELALYCPKHGYYETKKDNPGRRGDFYTSVGVGEVFGQLLAFQFSAWLGELLKARPAVQIVEAGAHDGQLAGDILGWLRLNRPELYGQIEYWLIEPSVRRQAWQKETLREFSPRVRWSANFDELKRDIQTAKCTGVVFSNELLDAMPVHRFGWHAAEGTWFEWGVSVENGRFVWRRLPVHFSSAIFHPPASPELLAVLPDGYTIETCPAAVSWWGEAAGVLERGKLMTIDYGLTADELFTPGRNRGTLRAYFRHQASEDVLANAGEQDLTAHVNFSGLQAAGESAGLKTEGVSTQSQFLTQIFERTLREKSSGEPAGSEHSEGGWTPARARQFQTLTHPEHLGRAFRVLVQSR